ncbi:MAG TPA: divalent-cation tolerance protein CutA [Chitinispirillaceae bacterium]|nr:divalent-cation tolerance protein CutA [Chitinispirillaceae bacterium]
MELILVYITTKDKQQARLIGKTLVEERLAACVNIIDGMQSIYWWEGAINEDNEAILIAKTRNSLLEKLTDRVKSLHTYTCPCIVAIPISGGNTDYLGWIKETTD